MKYLLLLLLCGCTTLAKTKPKKDYFLARITFYTDWQTAQGIKPVEGTTVAAAKKHKFGTKFYIPRLKEWMDTDGKFIVHDRGSAVERRVASRGKYPVIDVFVNSHAKVSELGARSNNIFKVYYQE